MFFNKLVGQDEAHGYKYSCNKPTYDFISIGIKIYEMLSRFMNLRVVAVHKQITQFLIESIHGPNKKN
jgi:hypothetical protein